jgi:AAA+ superfamily predicted ATPase
LYRHLYLIIEKNKNQYSGNDVDLKNIQDRFLENPVYREIMEETEQVFSKEFTEKMSRETKNKDNETS